MHMVPSCTAQILGTYSTVREYRPAKQVNVAANYQLFQHKRSLENLKKYWNQSFSLK